MRHLLLLCLLQVAFFGCLDKRTWLSDEVKRVVPYKEGQKLVFQSNTGMKDSLLITTIEAGRFPDGIGAPTNERMVIIASVNSRSVRSGTTRDILYMAARDGETEEMIKFELSLNQTFMSGYWMTYSDFETQELQVVESQHARYDDVIRVILPEKVHKNDRAICKMFWSKSAGYVRFVQTDGTIWDLTETTYRQQVDP